MRTFAEAPKATPQARSPNTTVISQYRLGQSDEVNAILHLQRTIGNQAVLRLLQSNAEERNTGLTGTTSRHFGHDFSRVPVSPPTAEVMQTKLAINKPGDDYEQEADRVAEQVMRMPEPRVQRACACGRACPKCKAEQLNQESKRLQTKRVRASNTEQVVAQPIVHDVLQSAGQPLQPDTRAFMETRFGRDFSKVKVHTDNKAAKSAQAINALAYTVGQHIVFGASQFSPATESGRRLLAHELTHVAQQGGDASTIQRTVSKCCRHVQTGNTTLDAISGFLGLEHCWIRTNTKEAGMGPADGGPLPANPFGIETEITNHAGETGNCIEFPAADEDCINQRLQIGRDTGGWYPWNNCNTFVNEILDTCKPLPRYIRYSDGTIIDTQTGQMTLGPGPKY